MAEEVRHEEFMGKASRRRPEEFNYVRYRIEGSVARMTLDRPEHNLLHEPMLRELAAGIESLDDKDDVKLVVLDSACKVFSGGIDIGEYTAERVFQMLDAFHAAFTAMLDVGKPVIVVVNGPAIAIRMSRFQGTSFVALRFKVVSGVSGFRASGSGPGGLSSSCAIPPIGSRTMDFA